MHDIKPELIGKAARAAREAIRGREDWIASEDDWISYIVPAALESVADNLRADAWDEGFLAGHETGRAVNPEYPDHPTNPYRIEARDE